MISHLLKSLNNKKSGRNNLTFSSISLGQNCLFFCHFPLCEGWTERPVAASTLPAPQDTWLHGI